jgi:succinate dehydrogenase/fumarate reductase cytochrome b subunit
MEVNKRRRFARMLFLFRKVHRTTGALLFVFFIVVAVTGLLLGWKKHSAGLILPKSYKGYIYQPCRMVAH